MDSTKFARTNYTVDDTRYSKPSPVSTASHHYPYNFADSVFSPRSRLMDFIPANDRQVNTYCPICKRDFTNDQIQEHLQIHDSRHLYKFEIRHDQPTKGIFKPSVGRAYPLVEPLEFYTNELAVSQKEDHYFFKDSKNYDAVDRNLFKQKADAATQTLSRPPLQYESNDTDLFNCMDNAFNSGKGPEFTAKDLMENNKLIPEKRQLEDYEVMKKRQSYLYSSKRPNSINF